MATEKPTPEAIGNYVADMGWSIEDTTKIIKVLLDYIADFEG